MWYRNRILSWNWNYGNYIVWLELENETKAYDILSYIEIGGLKVKL